jgi:hypothetical protein
MTSPPLPPNRRRRWIVGVVAVLVLGMGWWWLTTPVIDPRFVGVWSVASGEGWPDAWTITEDGRFTSLLLREEFRWGIAGANFTVRKQLNLTSLGGVRDMAVELWERIIRNQGHTLSMRFEIVEVETDRILVRSSQSREITFTRVPEEFAEQFRALKPELLNFDEL